MPQLLIWLNDENQDPGLFVMVDVGGLFFSGAISAAALRTFPQPTTAAFIKAQFITVGVTDIDAHQGFHLLKPHNDVSSEKLDPAITTEGVLLRQAWQRGGSWLI